MIASKLTRSELLDPREKEPERKLQLVEQANHLLYWAYVRGKWNKLWAKLTGHSAQLLDLVSVTANQSIVRRHYAGLQVVPIRQIRGSEGRSHDFDRHFQPLQEHTEDRWKSLALAYLTDVNLPPIQLIQVGENYFVRDGHHRVSVARAVGQTYIDAEVVVWETDQGPIPQPSSQAGGPSPSHVASPACLA